MDFESAILVRLADDDARKTLLDEAALERVLTATYDTDTTPVQGPFTAVYDHVETCPAPVSDALADAQWQDASGVRSATVRVNGVGADRRGADAVWRGAVVGKSTVGSSIIDKVGVTWQPPGEDGSSTATATVHMTAPAGAATRVTFPVTAAVLVRPHVFSMRELFVTSKAVRRQLEDAALSPPPAPGLRRTFPLTLLWILPAAVFDDADWLGAPDGANPDAARAARTAHAASWLAREGIALATVDHA